MEEERKPRPANPQHKRRPPQGGTSRPRRPAAPDGTPRRRRPPEGERPPRRRPPAPDGAARRRPAAPGEAPRRRRPPEDGMQPRRRPTSPDGAPRRRRPPENGMPPRRRRPQPPPPQQRGRRKKRRSRFPVFGLSMILYAVIFLFVAGKITKRVRAYMEEYEASRPQYAMDAYMSNLAPDYYSTLVRSAVENLPLTEYETADQIYERIYQSDPEGNFTYREKAGADFERKPAYEICCGASTVADITLTRINSTEVFKLPIWRADVPQSRLEIEAEPQYTVSAVYPTGSILKINGLTVSNVEVTEAEPEVMFSALELQYAQQPSSVECTVGGLYLCPVVEAFDENGIPLTPDEIPDKTAPVQRYVFRHADVQEPDAALVERTKNLTYAYINYVTNNGRNGANNLAVLSNYMLAGSSVSQLMNTILTDIAWNNQYEMRDDKLFEVTHIKQFSDRVCTCEVEFDIVLSKVVKNEYTGKICWTMVNTGYGWYATAMTLRP